MQVLRSAMALLLALVLAVSGGAAVAGDTAEAAAVPIRAMTFNIRLDTAADGPNAWPHRQDMVADLIRYEAPDVVGLQEVLLHQKEMLEGALADYSFVGVGRDDGAETGEFSPLGWRTDRFDLVDSGTFWLSPTPELPGKGWDAAYPRIATWAMLRDRGSGQLIRVLNTHFDHVGFRAKLESAAALAQWVGRENMPTIVLGDFNSPHPARRCSCWHMVDRPNCLIRAQSARPSLMVRRAPLPAFTLMQHRDSRSTTFLYHRALPHYATPL